MTTKPMRGANAFSRRSFDDPPAHFHPGYFWMINDRIDEAQLIGQLRDMAAHGAKSVCLHPCPPEFRPRIMPTYVDRPYLSKSYFQLIRNMVAECRKLGMNYWLYDEGGWPSGGACGQVLAQNPEAFLRQNIVDSGNGPVVLKRRSDPQAGAPYPNLLTPGVAETFIALTHERHRHSVGGDFGKTIRFAFMDEPKAPITSPGQLTWTDDLGEVFHRRKGYAIEPFFADLLRKPSDREPKAVTQARVDFYDVWSQLFVERFLAPIRTWCRRNNLLSGGHFGGEDEPGGNADYGYGHILRALRGLDLPGVDVIWRQLFPAQPGGTPYYDEPSSTLKCARGKLSRPFTKYASSVARQAGSPYVVTETFAVYGNGVTPAQMKWVTDHQYLQGATLMVVSNLSQSRRDHFMAGCRPHFGEVNPLWPYSDLFHRYVARLGYMLTRGRAVHTTALYYDVQSIWAGASRRKKAIARHFALSRQLLERQCDFDYVDDDALAAGRVAQGMLTVGKMRYDTILVPATDWMAPAARQALETFKASGGRVLDEHQADRVSPLVRITPRNGEIRCTKRAWKGHVLYFLTNEATRAVRVKIAVPERGVPVLCDPMDGKLYSIPNETGSAGTTIDWRFEPCGSALFLFGAKADAAGTVFHPGRRVLRLDHGWTLQPLRQIRVGPHDYENVPLKVAPKPARPGDWRKTLGAYFSGDAAYAINFDNPFSGAARLELGTVGHACTVRLNGAEVARRFWGPYTADLSGLLRKGSNRLEVIVTNTLANAIADPEVLRHWSTNCQPLSVYEDKQRAFEKESLASGLFGPVKIRFGRYAPAADE
jgi:hypothetical protein